MISVRFQGKPFNITVIQVYAPTSNAEETEVERVHEDLQDILGISELGRPRGMVWGGRREEGSGWGTHVYLCFFEIKKINK